MNSLVRYFIADIHLTDNEPVVLTGFLTFLDSLPDYCELYILGDLFDYWVGDDANTDLHRHVASALQALSVRHIKKYFVHGNRDFLLGKQYAKLCDMTLLSDVNCLSDASDKIIFLHGDLLCIDDIQYQKFRKKMHCKGLQTLFLLLPLFIRKKIASKLRQKSGEHNQIKSDYIMDVNQDAVVDMMIRNSANIMIHGHTHKPATHLFLIDENPVERIVLGAWHDGVSYIKQDVLNDSLKLYSHSFK